MAFTSTGVIEIRDSGNAANGAYYDVALANHGTDYSQQDAAQLSINDGACNNNTTLTSATGGFTAAMIANGVHIAGNNFVTGFYVITAVASSNSCTLDRNPTSGAAASNGVCNVGGACTTLVAPLSTTIVAGTTIYIKKGTYAWATLTVTDGTGAAGIKYIGYNAARNDVCVGANRPAITMSGAFVTGSSASFRNLIFSGTFNGNLITAGTYCTFDNVKGTMTNALAVTVFSPNTSSSFTRCEAVCTNGYGFNGIWSLCCSCYAHDSLIGFLAGTATQTNAVVVDCIADTCTTGIQSNQAGTKVIGCSVYNCTTGILLTAQAAGVYNSIISGCTTGVSSTAGTYLSQQRNDFNLYNNGAGDVTQFAKEANCLSGNPLFTDPANGDFTLGGGSPAFSAAGQVGTVVGAVGTYNNSVGVYQSGSSGSSWGAFVG